MKTKEQEEIKTFNKEKNKVGLVRNFLNKCKYSMQGLAYCFQNESSFVLEAICACFIIIFGIIFDIEFIEWVISFGSLALISVIELINTAIEATVDMVTQDYNEYAKIAKDCGSAATGIMTVLAIIVNILIFDEYIIEFIFNMFR